MLSEALPCFQLLRIGLDPAPGSNSPVSQDLYTFRPETPRCTFRLGRRAEVCDITLVSERNPELISRVHAEIYAEREEDALTGEWRVYLVDCSSHGTFVNDVRMTRGQRVELSDGDMVTFGQEDSDRLPEGSLAMQQESEFYFMFQKVRVRPQDFDAITAPKVQSLCGFQPVKFTDKGVNSGGDRIRELAKYPSSSGATLILNSIGSISKFKPQPLTFSRTKGDSPGGAGKQAQASLPQPSRTAEEESATTAPVSSPVTPSRSKCRNRRKSAHTVLPELEDEVPHGAEEPPPLKRPKMEREDEFHNYSMVWSPPGRRGSGEVGQNSPKIEREDPPSHQSKAWPVIGRRASQESSGLKQPKTEAGEEPSHYSRVWPVMERRLSEDAGGQRRIKTESTKSEPYGEEAQSLNVTPPNRKRRGRPRKHPTWNSCQVLTQTLYTVEQCAAERCHLPQDDTVQWVQCDDCDAWYHLACVGCNYNAVKDADFHCGCT
ncbi:transcription factor 19 [Ambystoma mexicanum]|uniref:transcription factor 19 n=1 Tax=Ambystoma mexicanum TaxID=8296 RepID=UPI0037E91CF3